MKEIILYAVPAFVLLLGVEALSFRLDPDRELVGYERRDTAASLTMGLTNVIVNAVWGLAVIAIYAGAYALTPLRMPSDQVWTYGLLFLADDLAFYWYHRISHEVRVFWASHVVHHSSQHFNLSTALRQPVVTMTSMPFWIPLALVGFAPWMIFLMQSISLTYQFWLHTERIGRLPAPVEAVFNTPSHHRVHHGANEQYLDRNYGGILIVWDRLFGTFAGERERVIYGLTTNIATFNPLRVAFHEYAAIWRDVRGAHSWRERAGYVLGGPGWTPAREGRGLAHDVAAESPPSPVVVSRAPV